jgi:hypothetical protein
MTTRSWTPRSLRSSDAPIRPLGKSNKMPSGRECLARMAAMRFPVAPPRCGRCRHDLFLRCPDCYPVRRSSPGPPTRATGRATGLGSVRVYQFPDVSRMSASGNVVDHCVCLQKRREAAIRSPAFEMSANGQILAFGNAALRHFGPCHDIARSRPDTFYTFQEMPSTEIGPSVATRQPTASCS